MDENVFAGECDNMKYIPAMKKGVTGFVTLETYALANAPRAAESLQRWHGAQLLVSHLSWSVTPASHFFKNQLCRKVADGLGANHQFSVANSPLTKGTLASMMKEIQRILKALLFEYRCAINDWETFAAMVQWALNSSHRERFGCSP